MCQLGCQVKCDIIFIVNQIDGHGQLNPSSIAVGFFLPFKFTEETLLFLQVDSRFLIPCLEKVVITVRSPLNAEQKMNTLKSLLNYAKNLKKMAIKILQMKSGHSSADDFFEDICRFRYTNRKIILIE